MKKTITKPDGTKEVVEGTAEEIAAYERQVRQEPVREETKKPGLLTDDIKRLIEDYAKQHLIQSQPISIPTVWQYPQHSDLCELKVAERGWMSVIPPRCTCGATPSTNPYPWYTITCTTNFTCPDCGMILGGLNSNALCNCARGADGKVLETSNVEARTRFQEQQKLFDITKYKFDLQYHNGNQRGWKL